MRVLLPMPPATSITLAIPKSSSFAENAPFCLACEEHVLRLQIAMDDALRVGRGEACQNPLQDRRRLPRAERARPRAYKR